MVVTIVSIQIGNGSHLLSSQPSHSPSGIAVGNPQSKLLHSLYPPSKKKTITRHAQYVGMQL